MLKGACRRLAVLGILGGCLAANPSGPETEALPSLAASQESLAPGGAIPFLPAYYRSWRKNAFDIGAQLVFPGSANINAADPNSPRYDELWSASVGLAAYYRGALSSWLHLYAGTTCAFLIGRDYDAGGGVTRTFSNETMINLGAGLRFGKGGFPLYVRVGGGALFWPQTVHSGTWGPITIDTDQYENSTGSFFEVGGGLVPAGAGKVSVDFAYAFGPKPVPAAGVGIEPSSYNPFTVTVNWTTEF